MNAQPSRSRTGISSVLTESGRARCAIIVGDMPDKFLRWVAGELQRYLRILSGATVPVLADVGSMRTGTLILIGGPDTNPPVARLHGTSSLRTDPLREDGFIIKSTSVNGTPAIVIAGQNEAGTMYGVYDFIERLGVVFQTTGDIFPRKRPTIVVPPLDVLSEPALRWRGHHLRHFVTPWMSADYLCGYLDQLAKLKCNYLEFMWYEGAPWVEYSYHGEKRLIGDIYAPESGYTSWRIETYGFGAADVLIGKEHFRKTGPFAPEFRPGMSPREAHAAARSFLGKVIEHAHRRKIRIWLGAGDCPFVPPNLARFSRRPPNLFGTSIPPGNPAGAGIWTEIMNRMIRTYPEADGYWLWLAEMYLAESDTASRAALKPFQKYRRQIPNGRAIGRMGYDLYVAHQNDEQLAADALLQVFYAKTVTERVRKHFPDARLGVSLLGRSYLFPALHAALPQDIALQSMEASICWNRGSRVPMENFATAPGRDMFLVPRLDDDENELAAQFNATVYQHDRVNVAAQYGVTGVAPQVGKTRGLEHNARFLADAAWKPGLTVAQFCRIEAARTFAGGAERAMTQAYLDLEAADMFLGLDVPIKKAGHCFCGIGNFLNYADSRDIIWMKEFERQALPVNGPNFSYWDVEKPDCVFIERMRFRCNRYEQAIRRLRGIQARLLKAGPLVPPGSRGELRYLAGKAGSYALHLETLCTLMNGHISYDAAFRARKKEDWKGMLAAFGRCEGYFSKAVTMAGKTAKAIDACVDDPTERQILFRYNVRFLRPIMEFRKFIGNVANYYRGRPYWEKVNWSIINPDLALRRYI